METAGGPPVTTAPGRVLGSAAGGLRRLEISRLLNCLSFWHRSSGRSPSAGSTASVQPRWLPPEHNDPAMGCGAVGAVMH